MQSAAEVDEPIRAAGQRREHVGRQGVHRQSRRVTFGGCGAGRLEEDAGIVDDSVHPADLVHLAGEFPGLGGAGQVADDDSRGVRGEVAERRRPLAGAGVEDNVMAFTHEGTGGGAAESVGGAGDEDTGHGIILPSVARQAPDSGSDPERSPLPRGRPTSPAWQSRPWRPPLVGAQDAKNEVLEHCRRAAESSAAEVTRSIPAPARSGARRHQRAPRRGSRAGRGWDFRRFAYSVTWPLRRRRPVPVAPACSVPSKLMRRGPGRGACREVAGLTRKHGRRRRGRWASRSRSSSPPRRACPRRRAGSTRAAARRC